MAEGGFLVKFDGKNDLRCASVSFNFDEWQYIVNNTEKLDLPDSVKKISIEVESEPLEAK